MLHISWEFHFYVILDYVLILPFNISNTLN